ncbi:MAG: hypothetical protein MZV70_28675 [Desulfobacterales bacterium]|nr:hypothetical protein [Desulfobacterales bacterium]
MARALKALGKEPQSAHRPADERQARWKGPPSSDRRWGFRAFLAMMRGGRALLNGETTHGEECRHQMAAGRDVPCLAMAASGGAWTR